MWRRIKKFFYVLFVPRDVRHQRMKERRVAQMARIPSTPVVGNVALPARVLTERTVLHRILILKMDHIGDFFASVDALCRLREAWPQSHITLVCDPVNNAVAHSLGIFDEIVTYRFFDERFERKTLILDDSGRDPRCSGIAGLGLNAYDVAIDLRHDFDTRPCLSYVNATFRVGYATAGPRPIDAPVLDLALSEIPPDGPEQLHATTRINMLVALMIDTFRPRPATQIQRLVDTNKLVRPFGDRPYMVMAPCARSANRTWPLANFAALAARFAEDQGLAIAVVGSAAEHEQAGMLCRALPPDSCVNLAGAPLPELPNLLAGADLYVGNDTGGTHLAALLGVPTLCIYGGVSDPHVWQPLGPIVSIIHSRTPCSYCHINVEEECSFSQRCMSEIPVARAYEQALNLLNGSSSDAISEDAENCLSADCSAGVI